MEEKTALYNKLIQGCLRGDRESQRGLYEHTAPVMFAICLRYADSYQTAEDLLQEGYIKVFRHLVHYRGEGSFEGWMKRIFVNTAIEHFRKQARMYPVVSLEAADAVARAGDSGDHLELEDLLGFIRELSPGYRTVFNLYVVEGYSHREIGELLGISEGTSKSQLSRARYLLQQKIAATDRVGRHEVLAK